MKHFNLKTSLFVFSILICAISFSCKSSSYTENQQNEQAVAKDTVAQSDINETHEDLLTVDYKQFYDELAPHGEWIEVTSGDLKSAEEKPTSGGEESDELNDILKDRSSTFQHITFGQLFGVNDAVAADANVGAFFVWKPDPSMAVAISAGAPVVAEEPPVVVEPAPVIYRPYTNGQWIASDEGWYFKAPTPYEEIVHHYGRWAYSPAMGWVWVPGRVRSPAWVDWREDENYVAWTPIPPDVYVVNNVIAPVPVYEDRYVVVEKRYFVEPVVYEHVYIDRVKIKGMKRLKGIYVQDRYIYNHGPEFVEIERFSGKPIAPYKVVTMNNDFRNTWIENNNINTFAPVFTKVKGKNRNVAVTQPEKFNNFQEFWNKNNSAGNKNKVEDIAKPNDNMNKQKESKELRENKPQKKNYIDDSKMKTGEKREKFNRKENTPKNKKESPGREINRERKDNPKKDSPGKDVNRERKDNPKKEVKREKSPDRPKKDNRDFKPSVEKSKDSHPDKQKGNPKRDKRK